MRINLLSYPDKYIRVLHRNQVYSALKFGVDMHRNLVYIVLAVREEWLPETK